MTIVQVGDLSINFPFEPYKCQEIYMSKVVECLEKGYNGVLESPTGTGKTLCLLCACLSWLEKRKQMLSKQLAAANGQQNQNEMVTQSVSNVFGLLKKAFSSREHENSTNFPQFKAPRIIYTSRTHSQLSQVIRELNKTQYKNIKVCYFGSRDKLCVNEDVRKEENNNVKNNLCRAKIQKRACPFYWGMNDSNYTLSLNNQVVDIEEFINLGRKHKFCPFFKYRENNEIADLILMPYNYILDPRIRRANKVDLQNSILIFDEAHNLEKICEDSASVSFSSKDLAGCLKECKQALANLMAEEEQIRQQMDESDLPFGKAAKAKEESPDCDISTKELAHLILILDHFEKRLDSIDFEKLTSLDQQNQALAENRQNLEKLRKLPGKILPGRFLSDLLNDCGLNFTLVEPIAQLVDKISAYLAQKSENSLWQSKGVYLHKLTEFLCTIHHKGDRDVFKVYIQNDQQLSRRQAAGGGGQQQKINKMLTKVNNGLVMNYWCFNASVSLDELKTEGIRSIIVTSGTLSPLNRFVDQLGLPFEIILENEHVIQPNQVTFNILRSGPDSNTLSASFDNRNNENYLNSLANTLMNLLRVVPEGLLVFFGSYAHLETCLESWRNSGLWDKMNNLKSICVEPKSKDQFQASVQAYANLINDKKNQKGASFFAVCRGKLSEGVDFADNAGRAVILVGIPYPPMMDPKVILKQWYLNESAQKNMNGTVWYNTEAVRAVNQAMGRVIRHKNDFGAIILADERFARWDKENFPKWLQNFVQTPTRFSSANNFASNFKQIIQFFKQHKQKSDLQAILQATSSEIMTKADVELKRKIFAFTATTSIKKPKTEQDEFSNINTFFKTEYDDSVDSSESPSTSIVGSSAVEALEQEFLDEKSTNRLAARDLVDTKRSCNIFSKSDSHSDSTVSNNNNNTTWKSKRLTIIKKKLLEETPNFKPESIDKLGNYVLDVKAAIPPEDYTKFYHACKKYKQDNRYEPFIDEIRRIFLPRFVELLKRLQGCLAAEHRERFEKEMSNL